MMVNMMREHVPQETRIHYVITNGGKAPNVVPDFAEVYYYVRHPDMRVLDGIWDRITDAAKGAALGTGTTTDLQLIGSVYNVIPNDYLSALQRKNLERVGGVAYSAEDRAFADRIRKTLAEPMLPLGSEATVVPTARRRVERLHRPGRRELARADRVDDGGDLGAGHAGAQLAGRGRRRHGHRREGDGGGREDDGADGDRSLQRPAARRAREGRAGPPPRRIHLPVAPGGGEAGPGLQEVTGMTG